MIMTFNKKQKISVFVLAIFFVLVIIFSLEKGKNSLKNKFFEAYNVTASNVSIELQHDYLWFFDFFHGYTHGGSRVGWISDIHADRFKRRTVDSGTLYPKSYSVYLPKVFDELRKQGITTVISDGDNTNAGDTYYAEELEKIAYRKNMQVLWVKGNHDSKAAMNKLGIAGDNFYYYKDFGNTRMIVLDDTQQADGTSWMDGGISQHQMDWFTAALKTEKNVVIAMHVPIFPVTQESTVLSTYAEFEKIVSESKNVKLVLTGHFHVKWDKQLDGVGYYGESALTRQGELGGYAIVDFNNISVKYLYAK